MSNYLKKLLILVIFVTSFIYKTNKLKADENFIPVAVFNLECSDCGLLVSTLNGKLIAKNILNKSETFELYYLADSDSTFVLKSKNSGKYLSVSNDGLCKVDSSEINEGCFFELSINNDCSVSFKAVKNGKFLSLNTNGDIIANSSYINDLEKFDFVFYSKIKH